MEIEPFARAMVHESATHDVRGKVMFAQVTLEGSMRTRKFGLEALLGWRPLPPGWRPLPVRLEAIWGHRY